ncbi:MAG: cobalamin B12-binding domain-containing protein [Candidatus Omnitrophica bacterium]|nr:cobalamin B12-binding domain-containing protein [Candidatus Omnitrophota bacterium]
MKITLISPFPTLEAVGLRILSACLKHAGHNVQMLFLRHEFNQKYTSSAMNQMSEIAEGSGLVGMTVFSNFYDNAVQMTQQFKKTLKAPVVWGGIHPTIRPEEGLHHADASCLGEAEDAVVELANKIEQGQNYFDTKSMWFRQNGNLIRNATAPIKKELDSLPYSDYDFENHFVLTHQDRIERMNLQLTEEYMGTEYMTMATRGCSFGCEFCCNNTLNQMDAQYRIVRKRDPLKVVQELVEARQKMPFLKSIKFDDDAFFFYPELKIKEFSDAYKERVGLPLCITGITPSTCSRPKLAHLVNAGLDSVRMGIETGSEKTKDLYKRNDSNQKMINSVAMLNEFHDKITKIQYDIILDNPWEGDDELVETLMMLVKFKPPYCLSLFSLTFYPETGLYRKAKEDGLIKDDLNDIYRKYFMGISKTYLNNLYVLLNTYSINGHQMPVKIMALMTDKKLRRWGVSYLVYLGCLIERKIFRAYQLFSRGLNALRRGEPRRIQKWFIRNFKLAV